MKQRSRQLFEISENTTPKESLLIRRADALRAFRAREFRADRAFQTASDHHAQEHADATLERDIALAQLAEEEKEVDQLI